jgi:hypothetical protein
MSDNETCDLCGLPTGMQDFCLRTPERTFRFCCEGCKGIYQMLNDIEDAPASTIENPLRGEKK